VSEFSAEWLALREPADWPARSRRVTEAVAGALAPGRLIRAVDLAAGTGSNARFLAPLLPSRQEWVLVDRSPQLLARAQRDAQFSLRARVVDLLRLEALDDVFTSCDLVTASALLDLVSEPWLEALCAICRRRRAVVLFALSYDGRIACTPEDANDERIRDLVNRHQRTDKGFGPALGPDAADRAAAHLAAAGYRVVRDRSDWVLEAESAELQRQVIAGWATAAMEMAPLEADTIAAWRQRRLTLVSERRSRLTVGHEDLGAFMA
jgi:SAM-dependent methyltransferase